MERKSQNALMMHLAPTLHLDFSFYNTFANILASFNKSLSLLEDKIILRKNSLCVCPKSLQSCMAFCSPMDCSPPGSSVHGILHTRALGWVAMPSSRGSSQPRDWTPYLLCLLHWQAGSLPRVSPGKPFKKNSLVQWNAPTLVCLYSSSIPVLGQGNVKYYWWVAEGSVWFLPERDKLWGT